MNNQKIITRNWRIRKVSIQVVLFSAGTANQRFSELGKRKHIISDFISGFILLAGFRTIYFVSNNESSNRQVCHSMFKSIVKPVQRSLRMFLKSPCIRNFEMGSFSSTAQKYENRAMHACLMILANYCFLKIAIY